MTITHIHFHEKNDPPIQAIQDVLDGATSVVHIADEVWVVILQGGMQSGGTSVTIVGKDSNGAVAITEISLAQLRTVMLSAGAKAEQWGDVL